MAETGQVEAEPDSSVRLFGKLSSTFPSISEIFDDEEDFMAYFTGFGILSLALAIIISRYVRVKLAES